jgi:DNA-binding YbaB/EbfC family protein
MKARLPKGMGGGPSNMNQMMRQVQQFQAEREALEEDLAGREYDIAAGGGAVKLKINGRHEIFDLVIDPEIIDPDDPETLQDIVTAAVNEAIKRAESEAAEAVSELSRRFGIPEGAL